MSAFISIPYSVEGLSGRPSRLASSCSSPAMTVSAHLRFVIVLAPFLSVPIIIPFECICNDAFKEDVDERWRQSAGFYAICITVRFIQHIHKCLSFIVGYI